jgi:hypothetical protein
MVFHLPSDLVAKRLRNDSNICFLQRVIWFERTPYSPKTTMTVRCPLITSEAAFLLDSPLNHSRGFLIFGHSLSVSLPWAWTLSPPCWKGPVKLKKPVGRPEFHRLARVHRRVRF